MAIGRRDVLAGMVTGGFAGTGTGAEALGQSGGDDAGVRDALHEIRDAISELRSGCVPVCPIVEQVRNAQRTFLRATSRYPDFIEVGTTPWERVWDWQARSGLAVDVARMADGRYGLRFGFTTLVLRPDAAPEFIGTAYDNR